MVTEIVLVKLPAAKSRDEVIANFEQTSPEWAANPDLIRKNYLFDPENGVAGGVYLWKEKAHAEKWHGAAFVERARQLYGAEPEIRLFETPIVVDNLTREISRK